MNEDRTPYRSKQPEFVRTRYLSSAPGQGAPLRQQVRFHMESLVKFTRLLNLAECRPENRIQPREMLDHSFFLYVKVCAGVIDEIGLKDMVPESKDWVERCWEAFLSLVGKLEVGGAREEFLAEAFLLLHLAAVILNRQVLDGSVETEPQMMDASPDYRRLAASFSLPLFEPEQTPTEQLVRLSRDIEDLYDRS